MRDVVQLKEAVNYSEDRINIDSVTLENFVTTDNLLQNKLGLTTAVNLPPQEGSLPSFNSDNILVANIRPYLKKIWFSNRNGGCSADVLVFKVKNEYDPKFVYYGMYRDDFFNHMMRGAKGTKMPRGDKNQVMEFTLPNFKKSIQKKIAAVLSALDAKIELNNRINTELEAMAKTLYDYWFVQFDFPISKEQAKAMGKPELTGKPYKSSGGKTVYDETLKREIPEGWGVKELSDIANITMGQSPSGSSYNETEDGEIFFQGSTDFGWRFPTIRQYTTEPGRMAKQDDILLSVRAPVGTMNIADIDCCIGRGVAALNSKEGFNGYLFYVMEYFKRIFYRRNSEGTTFGSITKDDLFSLKLVYPKTVQLGEYDTVVSKYNKKIFNNHKQSQQLAQLRDWLLPMLMNGQVTVK